ncbi:MAG: restriction endonuclease [Betaproteobacteria bacterium HGW-Betaproteobacteria-8]|nr:MAG: restriction endonuclease [Betaproteobacteria bacterium HGW-Betaproteobacteria-8]
MAISEFATYINPVISALKNLGGSAKAEEVCSTIAEELNLPTEILDKRLKNGVSRYENQIHWARFFLAKTGYIDSSKRGVWTLTELGQNAPIFSEEALKEIIRKVQLQTTKSKLQKPSSQIEYAESDESDLSPPDNSNQNYKDALLATLKSLPPDGFERVCQRLLREAGFEKVTVTGRSGDGGIDGNGVLQINPFVSFQILFQCKRYEGSVSASQVRDFRGAMAGRAEKGIILTTGTFTADAKRESMRDGVQPIELVDGEKLIQMFEELELGLVPRKTYDIDNHFFDGFRN